MYLCCRHPGFSVHWRAEKPPDADMPWFCPRPRLSTQIYDPYQTEAGVYNENVCNVLHTILPHTFAYGYNQLCVTVWISLPGPGRPPADLQQAEGGKFYRGQKRRSQNYCSVSFLVLFQLLLFMLMSWGIIHPSSPFGFCLSACLHMPPSRQ